MEGRLSPGPHVEPGQRFGRAEIHPRGCFGHRSVARWANTGGCLGLIRDVTAGVRFVPAGVAPVTHLSPRRTPHRPRGRAPAGGLLWRIATKTPVLYEYPGYLPPGRVPITAWHSGSPSEGCPVLPPVRQEEPPCARQSRSCWCSPQWVLPAASTTRRRPATSPRPPRRAASSA